MGEVGVSFSPTTVLARSLSSGEKFKKELRHQGKIIDTSQLSINLTQLLTHIGLRLGLHVMSLARGGEGGRGGTWVFFGWVCAARDSKLAPRSKKNFP